jgi:hypothetical protein
MSQTASRPETAFIWAIYADATFAGLSVLIPIPLLDVAFEQIFRRRMPRSIARARSRQLPPDVIRLLNHLGCSPAALLLFPLWLAFLLLKRLSKKILYFLTVKDAVDSLSYYWHRAFLLDYMMRAGHLDDLARAQQAERALAQTLDSARESPLSTLARQVVRQTSRVLRRLWSVVRRRREDDVLNAQQATMAATWSRFQSYLEGVAARYQAAYEAVQPPFSE